MTKNKNLNVRMNADASGLESVLGEHGSSCNSKASKRPREWLNKEGDTQSVSELMVEFAWNPSSESAQKETQRDLEDASHLKNLGKSLAGMLKRGELCDLSIKCKSGSSMQVHTVIVASSSPRLHRYLLTHPVKAVNLSEICDLPPAQKEALEDEEVVHELVFNYMYRGVLTLKKPDGSELDVENATVKHAVKLLAAAMGLAMQGCIALVVDLLKSLIKVTTAVQIYQASVDFECTELQLTVESFIDANFSSIVLEQAWMDASEKTVNSILKRNSLVTVDEEMECFRALARWALEDIDNRSSFSESMLLASDVFRIHWLTMDNLQEVLAHEVTEAIPSVRRLVETRVIELGKGSEISVNGLHPSCKRQAKTSSDLNALFATSSSASLSGLDLNNNFPSSPLVTYRTRSVSQIVQPHEQEVTQQVNIFKNVHVLSGHEKAVCALTTDDKNWIVSGSADFTIRVWDKNTCKGITVLKGHHDSISAVKFFHDFLISASFDRSIRVWSTQDWTFQHFVSEEAHEEAVTCLTVVTKNDQLASGSAGGEIKIWSHIDSWSTILETESFHEKHNEWQLVFILQNAHAHVLWSCCEWGGTIVGGSSDTEIRVWDSTTWTLKTRFLVHKDEVQALVVIDSELYSGSDDGVIAVYSSCEQEVDRPSRFHNLHRPILSLAGIGNYLVVGFGDGGIVLLNRDDLTTFAELKGHASGVMCLGSTGHSLLSGSFDQTIRVWQTTSH